MLAEPNVADQARGMIEVLDHAGTGRPRWTSAGRGPGQRYGIYIDTTSGYDLAENVVFASRAGLMVRGEEPHDEDADVKHS